jgi:hypothetical protein
LLVHFCFHLHTIVFSCTLMLLLPIAYHWSCSNLCMVVLTCVCPSLLPPTSGCSHLHVVIPHLLLFPARHCSPLIAPRPLLFHTCCCSPVVITPRFFKGTYEPLVVAAPVCPLLLPTCVSSYGTPSPFFAFCK